MAFRGLFPLGRVEPDTNDFKHAATPQNDYFRIELLYQGLETPIIGRFVMVHKIRYLISMQL